MKTLTSAKKKHENAREYKRNSIIFCSLLVHHSGVICRHTGIHETRTPCVNLCKTWSTRADREQQRRKTSQKGRKTSEAANSPPYTLGTREGRDGWLGKGESRH